MTQPQSSSIELLLTKEQRQKNMNEILDALNPEQTEFNTMILSFADIIQSSFYNYLTSQTATEKERNEMDERLNRTISEVMQVLNMKSLSNPEDMVILTTVMIEAIMKALVRQEQSGQRVSQQLHHLRTAAR